MMRAATDTTIVTAATVKAMALALARRRAFFPCQSGSGAIISPKAFAPAITAIMQAIAAMTVMVVLTAAPCVCTTV